MKASARGVNRPCKASRVIGVLIESTIAAREGCFIPTWPIVMSARKLNASKLRDRWINFAALAQDLTVFFKG